MIDFLKQIMIQMNMNHLCNIFMKKNQLKKGEIIKIGKKNHISVKPKQGSVLVFQHDIFHEGSKLLDGTKYLIRADVMYSSKKYTRAEVDK